MADKQVQVLIVGAGLAGTSAAMFLAQRGVEVLVVEKHPGTSIHPRAAGQHPRTMELLHTAGLTDDVLKVSFGLEKGLVIKVAETVRGKVLHTIVEKPSDLDTSALSAQPWGMASQCQLEPMMLARAEEFGAEVLFSTELVDFEQDGLGVTARLLDRWSERLTTVRADYLLAADGHRSPIREALGIARHGLGSLGHIVGVTFEADLSQHVEQGAALVYYLRNATFTGAFGNTPDANRYIFACEYHPERGESTQDFPPERLTELIRIALDDPGLPVKILSAQPWEMAARIADRFSDDRVFLVGDAAKVTPPTGGLGGNTAVGDGFDLGWKLAAVLSGEAGPGLLDSYHAERRPVAEQVVNTSLHNAKARLAPQLDLTGCPEPLDMLTVVAGLRCRSGAVLAEDSDPAPAEDPAKPSGRPGFRAPHVPLLRDGALISTHDLFGPGWTLLTGEEGGVWQAAARSAADTLGVPLATYGLSPELADPAGQLTEKYGIRHNGASLIRPDGVVAWRSEHEVTDPAGVLLGVLARLLDRRVPAHAA